MKNTETKVIRHIDKLGRLSMPIDARRAMDIGPDDPIAIEYNSETMTLRKYRKPYICAVCGNTTTSHAGGMLLCKTCHDMIIRNWKED